MNPDILAPGRALRLDLEPQLRGPPGPRRAHPPRLPADGRRGRDRGPLRRHPGVELTWKPIQVIKGRVTSLKRADVDTDQIIPKQFLKRIERTGFGEFLFYDWAQEPGWSLPKNPILATGRELRLRLEPRARPVGAAGLRLPGDRRVVLRRHLLLQLHEDRPAAGRAAGGGRPALMEAGEAEVDLEALEVRFDGRAVPFELDEERRHRLLNGLDDIDLTLQKADDISAYEAERERPGPVTLNL